MNLADSALPQTTDRSSSQTNLSCSELSRLEPDLIPEDDDDVESAMRVAMRQMLGIFAELDRKSIKYKLRAARTRARTKNGRCEGRKPFGDRPGEQDTVKRMQQLSTEGLSVAGICKRLNDEGIKPRGSKKYGVGEWYPQQILKILRRIKKRSPQPV
jgi:DNA invertase Pin-like site-specific DNA recombinase